MFADVRRGKTIAAAVEASTVSDSDGNVIDTSEFFGTPDPQDADQDAEDAEHDETDEADASSEEPSGDTK
jgi:trigger factor